MSKAIRPTFNAFKDTRVRRVKTTGRITADLNLRANKSGNISFFNLPRASARKKLFKALNNCLALRSASY